MDKAIVLLGRAGSGKSTIGRNIANQLGWHYVSTGDIARGLMDDGVISDYWHGMGAFAPEDAIRDAFKVEVGKHQHVIVDGMPRKPEQIDFLHSITDDIEYFLLDVPEDVARERLYSRGRSDDIEDNIKKRHSEFNRTTMKAIRAIPTEKLNTIDGSRDIEEIADIIVSRIV